MNDQPTLLEDAARRLDVRIGDVERVKARARSRGRRRRSGIAVLTSVSLLAGAGMVVLRNGQAGDEGAPIAVVGAAAVRGDVPMRWEQLDPSSGLGMARDVGFDGTLSSPLYALSTAPGTADVGKERPSRVVWRSEDGVEWTPSSTLGSDLYLSDLSSTPTRVFAVGTAPATAVAGRRVSPPVLGWSDDGARTWNRADVDLDLATIAAGSSTMTIVGSDVATGPKGTLAVLTIASTLDVASRLPVGTRAPDGWAITAEGVDVLGPMPDRPCPDGMTAEKGIPEGEGAPAERHGVACVRDGQFVRMVTAQEVQGVIASYPWAALGVSGDLLRAVRRQPFGYFAPEGSTDFVRVELPPLAPVADVLVQARADGFDLAASSLEAGVTVLETTDGTSWAAGDVPGGLQWVQAIGRLDGRVAMVGSTASGSAIVRADGSGGWQSTDLTSAIDPALTHDGRKAYVTAAGIGPLGAVVSVVVVSDGGREEDVRRRLLVTRDGITWSDASVDDLAGRRIRGVTRILVTGDRALVTLSVAPADPDDDRHDQVVLLGAPA